MLNVLIADDNIYFVKNLINFVIGKNSNIKITNIASTGLEVLKIIEKDPSKIDLILLDLKMPDLDGIETLDRIYSMNLSHFPNIFVISSENFLINKIIQHPLVIDWVNKLESMDTIFNKLQNYEKQLNFSKIREELEQKVYSELIQLGYNPSHVGTHYLKDCILTIYEKGSSGYSQNLENFAYKKVAFSHNKSVNTVKSNIMKATTSMFLEADMSFLKNYFNFNDIRKKPTPKVVISTILNKL